MNVCMVLTVHMVPCIERREGGDNHSIVFFYSIFCEMQVALGNSSQVLGVVPSGLALSGHRYSICVFYARFFVTQPLIILTCQHVVLCFLCPRSHSLQSRTVTVFFVRLDILFSLPVGHNDVIRLFLSIQWHALYMCWWRTGIVTLSITMEVNVVLSVGYVCCFISAGSGVVFCNFSKV